ncbi:MAG TPA: sugar ABC transporter permease [Geminicoccus sp.]|uniref:carbohydrate ABC transporter permease n=1 Tax=Geminicoccus sp. TaxID=2024832 RepID=UPI002D12050B|nr:sugar ABC transporter permease [Geminicoccus sp.]HWL69840.1 sugar ABC transporter permease [Geminicoccus sp.]
MAGPATSRLTRTRTRAAWLFLAPMLVALALVAAWPLGRTVWFAFTDANLSDMGAAGFVGLANFEYLLTDPEWWRSVWNTLFFALVSVSLETVLGLAIALALNVHLPGRGLLRTAVLIPWAIPTIVSAQMWAWMLNDVYGVLNELLILLGIIDQGIAWTANPDTAIWAVIMVDVWKTTPFMALLLLAGLQMLPTECYEAAKVDGVHPVEVFWKVTLPLLMPALLVAVIFRLLDALRIFDAIYVLTGNNQATMSMSVYARQQLVDFQDVGFGSAASTLLFLTIALFTAVYLTLARIGSGQAEEKP